MQALDHAALQTDDFGLGIFGSGKSFDDAPGPEKLLGARCEGFVGNGDLGRMDQGLSVEAEIAALHAFGAQAVAVVDVVERTVENGEPVEYGARLFRVEP